VAVLEVKAWRLLKAVYCWLVGGCPVTYSANARMKICKSCEFFSSGKCDLCGCVLKFKTKMETEKCPINKW
jgi:hypothetical protein